MAEANLLVTHDPSYAGSAKEEVEKAFKAIKQKTRFLKSDCEGIFNLRVGNPKKVVKCLSKFKNKTEMFKHTFHWIPIQKWITTKIEPMQKEIKKLQRGIKKTEAWKIDLHKRHFDMPSSELIIKLTEVVDKPKVDLDNPKKILEVQIMGKKTGLALLDKGDMLTVVHK
ncbi:MAG: THUMP domain-containing protein [Nanoarchaeota archaeon]